MIHHKLLGVPDYKKTAALCIGGIYEYLQFLIYVNSWIPSKTFFSSTDPSHKSCTTFTPPRTFAFSFLCRPSEVDHCWAETCFVDTRSTLAVEGENPGENSSGKARTRCSHLLYSWIEGQCCVGWFGQPYYKGTIVVLWPIKYESHASWNFHWAQNSSQGANLMCFL